MIPTPRQSVAIVGASAGIVAAVILALTTCARVTELPAVWVAPAIRAWDAGVRR